MDQDRFELTLTPAAAGTTDEAADSARRFGGLDRLYGAGAATRLRAAHVAVVGLGGVGSWTVEALARSGIGALTLIDLDHISESNVNRQIHALTETLGQSKALAMAERVTAINPDCAITVVDDFVTPDNVAEVLADRYTAIVDCADQAAAKIAMILHARGVKTPLILCGGAGGKTDPLALRAGDLSEAVNDALLAKLRNTLRRHHGYPRNVDTHNKALKRVPKMGVRALWFDQQVVLPDAWQSDAPTPAGMAPQGLSCAGYGSVVTVTASMGLAAANLALQLALRQPHVEPAAQGVR